MIKSTLFLLLFISSLPAQYFDFQLSDRIKLDNYSIANFNNDSLTLWSNNNYRSRKISINSIFKIVERKKNNFSVFAKSVPIAAGIFGTAGFVIDINTKIPEERYAYKKTMRFAAIGAALGAIVGSIRAFPRNTKHDLSTMEDSEKNTLVMKLIDKYYSTYLSDKSLKYDPCNKELNEENISNSFNRMLYTFKKNRWQIISTNKDKSEIIAEIRSGTPFKAELLAFIDSDGYINIKRNEKKYISKFDKRYLVKWLKRLERTYYSVKCVDPDLL